MTARSSGSFQSRGADHRGYLLTSDGAADRNAVKPTTENSAARYPKDAVRSSIWRNLYWRRLAPSEALAACDRAIAIGSQSYRGTSHEGVSLSELGRLEDAARSIQHVRSVDSGVSIVPQAFNEKNRTCHQPPVNPEALYLNRGSSI